MPGKSWKCYATKFAGYKNKYYFKNNLKKVELINFRIC